MRIVLLSCLAVLAAPLACGNPADTPSASVPVTSASGSPPAPRRVALAEMTDAAISTTPPPPFPHGDKALATVKEALLHHYDGADVTEDELDRAAVQGMLEHIDARRASWNKLLAPDDLSAIEMDLKGEIIGIGAEVNFDSTTGYTDIVGVLPGSPAERAGLVSGDRILDIDGRLFKGKTQKDMLAQIRGKAGETVTLNILRDDKVLTMPIVRQRVSLEAVRDGMLPEGVGYLQIRSFNAKTRPAVDEGLDALVKSEARALVLDLRGNPGGGFDDALSTAEAFLPAGAGVAKVQKHGEREQLFTVQTGATKLANVPMAVLIDGETASGAELLTAALHLGRKATVVGERTFGKWSLQTIEELGNGYAAKYTISLLRSPTGETYDGIGYAPDIEVDMDHKAHLAAEREHDLTARVAVDSQLRTAVALVRGR